MASGAGAIASKVLAGKYEITSFRELFSDAKQNGDELFCVFGSAGFLEIAMQNSSAAAMLDIKRGERIILELDCGK